MFSPPGQDTAPPHRRKSSFATDRCCSCNCLWYLYSLQEDSPAKCPCLSWYLKNRLIGRFAHRRYERSIGAMGNWVLHQPNELFMKGVEAWNAVGGWHCC